MESTKTTSSTNGRAKAKSAEPNVAESFSDLAHDAVELAELQAELLKLDLQTATRDAGISVTLVVVGACLLVGCVPVALIALGEMLIARWDWSRAGGYGIAAAIGLVLSAAAGVPAWYYVQSALAALRRSRDELGRNIAWIKSSLRRGRRTD